jgi:putative hydroxymethylpyrimidine transport system substrate-binding protein
MRSASVKAPVAAVVVASLVGLAGCGEKSEEGTTAELREFTLALDWFPNPDHAGIYEAVESGHFAEAGLEVRPQVPSDPSAPIKQVAAGRVDLAISYEPEVLLARNEGLEVVAVGALVQEPLTSLISLGDELPTARDLAGKRVATAGIPYQTAYLRAILERSGINPDEVEQVDVGLNLLSSLLSGKVDATLGMFWNIEGVELRERGESPRIERVDELGIPTYDELVLVANAERLTEDPEPVRLFIAALERGTRDAARDPEGATRALLNANEDLDPALTRAQVDETVRVLLPRGGEEPFGYMDPARWERFAGFLVDEGLIDAPPDVDDVLSNEHLPGRIPD